MLLKKAAEREFAATGIEGIERALFRNNAAGGRSSVVRLTAGSRFPRHAHHGTEEVVVLAGVVQIGGEWYYEENARNGGVSSLGMDSASTGSAAGATPPPATEERNRILDLFRN